jgi:uncharacterized membrane protein
VTERRLRAVAAGLALVGLAIGAYLTYIHYAELKPLCAGGSGGCERVQNSAYATLAGIPIALLGSLTHLAILASLLFRGENALLAGAGVALVGFGFSLYLTGLELFEIQAICQWCVANAVLMTLLAIVTVARVVVGPGVEATASR